MITHLPKTPTGKVQRLSVGKAMLAKDHEAVEASADTKTKPGAKCSTKNISDVVSSGLQDMTDHWWRWMLTGTVLASVFVGLIHVKGGAKLLTK